MYGFSKEGRAIDPSLVGTLSANEAALDLELIQFVLSLEASPVCSRDEEGRNF